MTRMPPGLARAYSATGRAWQEGAGRVYDRLAEVVVGCSPVDLARRLLLDVGAGTGAASRAIAACGGEVIAVDAAAGMLVVHQDCRPPAVAADAAALPFPDGWVDGAVAAFSLNHVDDVVAALRETARVTRPGGPVVMSAYAADAPDHPAKAAVNTALAALGWEPPDWYDHVHAVTGPALGTPSRCLAAAGAAGLTAHVHRVDVPFPELDASALVAWRLGMADAAPFVADLPTSTRAALVDEAVARLGPRLPPLVRSILVLTAVV